MKFKHCFQRAAAVMACLMLFCNLASAAETVNVRPSYKQLTQDQLDAKCSLSLTYKDGDTAISDAEFTLYQVAEMDENLQFTITDQFQDYQVFAQDTDGNLVINTPNYNGWEKLAETMSQYVAQDSEKLTPAGQAKTNAEGEISFADLNVGLYLMVGEQKTVNSTIYTPVPVMLTLPSWNAETSNWGFAVQGIVKFTPSTVPSGGGDSTVTRRVTKVWEDDDPDERPASITVNLLRNGEVYRTATLSASNNWRAEWTGLPSGSTWQLTEADVPSNYTVSINQSGNAFVVTNTYVVDIDEEEPPLAPGPDIGDPDVDIPDENPPTTGVDPEDPGDIDIPDDMPPLADLPQTGMLWWPVPLLAVAGVAMILVGVARRRNGD